MLPPHPQRVCLPSQVKSTESRALLSEEKGKTPSEQQIGGPSEHVLHSREREVGGLLRPPKKPDLGAGINLVEATASESRIQSCERPRECLRVPNLIDLA